MTSHLAVGLALALASAITLNVAFLMQQHAANRLPALTLRAPLRSARLLIGARLWLAGFLLGLGGWAFYFAALTSAPLSLVQTVAAGGIGLLVIIAAVWHRSIPPARERIGAAIATAGLAALAVSIPGSPVGSIASRGPSILLIGLSVGLIAAASKLVRRSQAGSIGIAAGVFYGLGDVWTKVLLDALPAHPGFLDLIGQPALYATVAAHGAGFLALQRAFQRGGPVAAVAPMTAMTNLLPMLAGPLVLGEALPTSPLLLTLRVVAFSGTAFGAALLARARAGDHASVPLAEQTPVPRSAGDVGTQRSAPAARFSRDQGRPDMSADRWANRSNNAPRSSRSAP